MCGVLVCVVCVGGCEWGVGYLCVWRGGSSATQATCRSRLDLSRDAAQHNQTGCDWFKFGYLVGFRYLVVYRLQ